MKRLENIIDDRATDKNTTHSYLPVYQMLLESKQATAKNILEIGIGHGGSIKLWNDYFPNADIFGLDINLSWGLRCDLSSPRIHLHLDNAYTEKCLSMFEPGTFDAVIDDGPHTLESMLFCVERYSTLLKPDGLLIIEDIPILEWTQKLAEVLPKNMTYVVDDRRWIKGRFDDIMFIARYAFKGISLDTEGLINAA